MDGDIPNAVLSVRFDQCGYWSTPISLIAAGSRLSLTTSVISLSDHEGPGVHAWLHVREALKVELLDEFPWQVFRKRLDILRAEKRVDVLNVRCVLQAADRVD